MIGLGAFLIFVIPKVRISPGSRGSANLGLSGELLQTFQLEMQSEDYDSAVFIGEGADAGIRIHRFENWSIEKADNYVSDKMFVIRTLYREIHSPYPGPLSNTIECAEEFKPERMEHPPFDYYLLYATERLTYGACSWDLISYRVIMYFAFCEADNSFYQIELFIPAGQDTAHYEKSLKSVMCSG